jgi:hypothetical protein
MIISTHSKYAWCCPAAAAQQALIRLSSFRLLANRVPLDANWITSESAYGETPPPS